MNKCISSLEQYLCMGDMNVSLQSHLHLREYVVNGAPARLSLVFSFCGQSILLGSLYCRYCY